MNKQALTLLTLIRVVLCELPFFSNLPALQALQILQQTTPKPTDCSQYTSQLLDLFNLLCTNIANGQDNVLRDSCVGCFQRATTSNNNQPSSNDLIECAQNYLINTRYDACLREIDTNVFNTDTGCITGYCRFVRCIRRVNSDLLISDCYGEASIDNDALLEDDQIMLIKNITSCILARTRCAQINPITGQLQTNANTITTTTYDKWGKPKTTNITLYNSLQITPDGDLRIISLPGITKIKNYFCVTQPNLRQSNWLEYSC